MACRIAAQSRRVKGPEGLPLENVRGFERGGIRGCGWTWSARLGWAECKRTRCARCARCARSEEEEGRRRGGGGEEQRGGGREEERWTPDQGWAPGEGQRAGAEAAEVAAGKRLQGKGGRVLRGSTTQATPPVDTSITLNTPFDPWGSREWVYMAGMRHIAQGHEAQGPRQG